MQHRPINSMQNIRITSIQRFVASEFHHSGNNRNDTNIWKRVRREDQRLISHVWRAKADTVNQMKKRGVMWLKMPLSRSTGEQEGRGSQEIEHRRIPAAYWLQTDLKKTTPDIVEIVNVDDFHFPVSGKKNDDPLKRGGSGLADWRQAGGGRVTTSARGSLPALLRAELGYNLRFHWGYLDVTIQTTSSTITPTNTQAGLLSLRGHGRRLRLRLCRTPGFQRGQCGLEGG